jgi:hypothetical protein
MAFNHPLDSCTASRRLQRMTCGSTTQMAPTAEEAKKLAAWLEQPGRSTADLCDPERFLAAMARVPRMRAKCGVLLFRAQFSALLVDVRSALDCVHAACSQVLPCKKSDDDDVKLSLSCLPTFSVATRCHHYHRHSWREKGHGGGLSWGVQVRDSRRLQTVLAAALQVGNAINRGSYLGDAKAVRVESLLRMADLRVRNPSSHAGSLELAPVQSIWEASVAVQANENSGSGAAPHQAAQLGRTAVEGKELKGVKGTAPRIRTLMEVVAWVVHAQDMQHRNSHPEGLPGHDASVADSGHIHVGYLRAELAAVEEAAKKIKVHSILSVSLYQSRWVRIIFIAVNIFLRCFQDCYATQGDMAEALKGIDMGIAAAMEECQACLLEERKEYADMGPHAQQQTAYSLQERIEAKDCVRETKLPGDKSLVELHGQHVESMPESQTCHLSNFTRNLRTFLVC